MAKKQGKDRLTWRGWAAAAALLLAVGVGVWCWRGGTDARERVPPGADADATKRVPPGVDATKRVPSGAGGHDARRVSRVAERGRDKREVPARPEVEAVMKMTVGEATNALRRVRQMQDPDDPSEYGPVEQMIGALLSTPLGVEPIPFPYDFDGDGGVSDYIASVSNRVVVTEKDSDREADHKTAIIEAKMEILEALKQGETPQTVLEEAYRIRLAAAKLRGEMIAAIQDWIIDDSPDDASVDAALREFNLRLADDGVLTITKEEIEDDLQGRYDRRFEDE